MKILHGNVEGLPTHFAFTGGWELFLSILDAYQHLNIGLAVIPPPRPTAIFLTFCQTASNPVPPKEFWISTSVSYTRGIVLNLRDL